MNHHQKNQIKIGSSIQISSNDRKPSKKFTNPNQINQTTTTLLNSFQDQLQLDQQHAHPHLNPNPMSLVPSPSRGLAHEPKHLQKLDLKNHDFQLRYFEEWIKPKISKHRESFPNPLAINLERAHYVPISPTDDLITQQLTSLGTLLREIRKLREGILASHRIDQFAIQIYELSAELALESCDLPQLNSLLPHLIFTLYQSLPLSSQHPSKSNPSKAFEDQEDRRSIFISVILLLPISTRLDLCGFLETFQQIPLSHHSILNPSDYPQRLSNTIQIYQSINRKNWVRFQKISEPLLSRLNEGSLEKKDEKPSNRIIPWDWVILLHLKKLIRDQLVWNSIQASFYSISDVKYLMKTFSLKSIDEVQSWLKFKRLDHQFQNGTLHLKRLTNS
ncbi:hypothetical protein DFH28DRAFT_885581 [Melampsora americana]|nr:hypothetical protein DFH28DRAFT_885581 [Melampsora americana]